MAKKTRRCAAARDQLGCMWGFMNMFTFRHGPLSHKLLLEPKHAAGSPRNNEHDKSKCHAKDVQETHVGEERNVTITIIKPSVKKLIAEELFNDKKQRENAEAGQLSDSELEGRRRNNHKRKNKTRKNSCGDFSHILKTADTEVPKVNRRTKKSYHGSERSLDIDNMVEEFCSEMHRRSSTSSGKNGMLNHKHGQDYKKKLRELVKFLISQKKLLHGENSEILTSKDLMEVFQILGSDEELFLKLLQDPEILVPDQSQKGEESLSLFERTGQSSFADKRWFRRKKDTPQQEVTDDDKECEDRIFILKPRSASFSSLSPDSHLMRNKTQQERNTSHFFLSEIKRKLKQAIRKEGEGYPKNVPSKDHFFLERMAKPSTKSEKRKHYDDDKKQRVSNIYIEAKKHLSEMLNNADVVDSNSTSGQFQNSSLGTILSLPEYLSPLSSPWEKSSPTHRKSASADFINAVHISKRETPVSLPNHARKNDDLPVCDLSKEPTESVGIEDGTANEDKLSAAGSADDVMITNEIDIVPEEASSTLLSDLPKAEAHDKHRDGIISKQASHEERQPPPSPSAASPSHCLAKSEECKSAAHDVPEWSSPISVLEPLFIEDDISPPKMRSQSDDEAQVQPWCIHFDDKEDSAKTIITSDKELVFTYVRDVLDAVVSDFEELYLKAQFSDQLLEPSLISNIPFCPNQLCHDHELLFDCINEVIMELCCCPPWVSFVAPRRTRVFSTVKSIVHEVQEAVYWHLSPLPLPHALDQIVRKDMAKAGNWLDIRCDIDSIGSETSELILEELLEELITVNCLNNSEHSLVPAELKTDESMILVL
ncbi:GPI-anchored adhesin-like protein [Hirschfeldia incana]|nr:GPI-anchored adhesin-like protein [Hirschfeldia incana]KAJ0250021.1 GPI-anchored adhesin-like protein [Hirschfeldia incana]KAJ0250022.1 GPI-anchored adhesin-like protein [Hirschfeldia incana]